MQQEKSFRLPANKKYQRAEYTNTQKDAAALTKSSEEMVISGMIMTSAAVVVETAAMAAKSHMSRHQKVNIRENK